MPSTVPSAPQLALREPEVGAGQGSWMTTGPASEAASGFI